MAGRRIRDAAEARSCLSAAARSGLARAEWAREHGIDGRSLQAWRLNLSRPRPESPRFIELVPEESPDPARYVVHIGEFSVEVDERFEPGTLRRLLGVLASC